MSNMYQYENDFQLAVQFVVDEQDLVDTSEVLQGQEIQIAEADDNDNEIMDEDILVFDANMQMNEEIKITAPGQGKNPVPWHKIEDIEELSFPTIFGGYPFGVNSSISYSDRVKSECRQKDRRSCVPTRVLYMAKKKLEMSCISSINMCLRKSKKTKDVTASNVLQSEFVNSLIKFDDGYRILKQVRSSPSYWETKKKDLLAMIRQLGKPTIFLTLSAGEIMWPELLKALYNLKYNKHISVEEAFKLSDNEKTLLIKNDPVTCARYFDYKISKLMILLRKKNSIFGKYVLIDSYNRVEFQMRGSPHEHILLWLKDAPVYDVANSESVDNYISFINEFITCEYDANNPYVVIQRHKHTHTCHKGKRNEQKCRFNYPIPVIPRTMVLEPLLESEKNESIKDSNKKIKKLMHYYFMKNQFVSFDDILKHLELTEAQYILSLRYPLKRTQVFLKRSSLEVGINCYNKDILELFESNMDIQVIVEEYGLVSYIINYIAKMESGMSKLLRDAASDISNGNNSIKQKFSKITNVFINSNMMSAQEASYHALSLSLSKMSRNCIYINTNPINERVMMLKLNKDLKKLNPNSTDIFMDTIFLKYSKRPASMENTCLADFVSMYSAQKKRHEDDINDDQITIKIKNKQSIIRYRKYKLVQDPVNYYREQLLLFFPWRNEINEIENIVCELKYNLHQEIIEFNRRKYSICSDEILDIALVNVQNELIEIEDEDIQNFIDDQLPHDQQIDIAVQEGTDYSNNNKHLNRIACPKRISEDAMYSLVKNLNLLQKEFVMHVLKCIKSETDPLRYFLSGSAGVGKSTVINCLYQLVTHYFDNIPGGNKDKVVVLLCAPSGKAAFLINGVTLHTAFALPVTQFAGNMPELSSDIANNIREKLFNLKLLIIDEISMVGSTLFNRVDTRLRQIMGKNSSFGGISVICVGDLNQLPPVMDSYIFKMPKSNQLSSLFDSNPLWDEFNIFELTQIMRQKDEIEFITALNNLAAAKMTERDIQLISSRQVNESQIPDKSIRLFAENRNVDLYNKLKISKHPGEAYKSAAKDNILGKISESTRASVLNSLLKKKVSEVNGLPHEIIFKIGIKYMITYNIDVEDGLVNGACGMLEHITFKVNTSEPDKVWLYFDLPTIGNKARLPFSEQMRNENISCRLTPISKISNVLNLSNKLQHQIVRQQFPLVPAEALTIHKSQGQTYLNICVDFIKSKRITRNMLYVALSRVTKLSGLHILGNFKKPSSNINQDPSMIELTKLRSTKQLKLSFNTLKGETNLKIIYLNICSLTTKLQYVISDAWYLRGDVLIFCETLTKPYDQINIPHFNIAFRSDCKNNSRGLICYCKDGLDFTHIHHIIDTQVNSHVELLSFKILNVTIVTGYKSPNASQVSFETGVKNIMNVLISNDHDNIMFMGDFNFDIMNNHNTFLSSTLSSYKLTTKLASGISTTNLKTQIDVVFSTMSNIEADVYETYFSYHKAIYAIVKDVIGNVVQMCEDAQPINRNSLCDRKSNNPISAENKSVCNKMPIKKDSELKNKCPSTSTNDDDNKTNVNISKMHYKIRLTEQEMNIVLAPINGYMEDQHINVFIEIVSSHTEFQMQNPLLLQSPSMIRRVPNNKPDLQILFSQNEGASVGHWICTYYDGIDTIYVYNSLCNGRLHKNHKLYISHLYGTANKNIIFRKVQQQRNSYDCGIFSMAFATSICHNRNPENEKYIENQMRPHVAEMFNTKLLIPFPTLSK